MVTCNIKFKISWHPEGKGLKYYFISIVLCKPKMFHNSGRVPNSYLIPFKTFY